MLKISKGRTFDREITLKGDVEGSFTATFKALTRTDVDDIQAKTLSDREFLDRILVRVTGIGNAEGTPYPADEARNLVIEDLDICRQTMAVFHASYLDAKSGN